MEIPTREFNEYRDQRIKHWDSIAIQSDQWKGLGGYYHKRIIQIYQSWVQAGSRVLEIGCGQGDLLASLRPSQGVGIDYSKEMILRAKKRYPDIRFYERDANKLDLEEKDFDYIILSDLLNDVWDVQVILEEISHYCTNHTRMFINSYSRVWEVPLSIAERLGLAKPVLNQNWLTVEDINNLLGLSGFETIRVWQEIISPLQIPLVTQFFNRFLVKLWPINALALTNFLMARKKPSSHTKSVSSTVSIIIPARNEAGNIPRIFQSLPEFGYETELIFVEGNSKDDTYSVIAQNMMANPAVKCRLIHQSGSGKGEAVREGFEVASGDVLMILDADLAVPFEYLPRFLEALISKRGELINGVRLVYPMEERSMRFLNLLGNKFFSLAFSWVIGQPIKDTLCGTKVLWRNDYLRIARNRIYFGDFDPFGDFDLLLGAAKLGLKIVDMPVRYQERTYGQTNISRWKHGWLLFKMLVYAARKIKFQ